MEVSRKSRGIDATPWLFAALSLYPMAARADAIIPYMAVPWGQAVLLPLVIVVEAVVLRRILGGRFLSAFVQSFVANLASTALGAGLYVLTMPALSEPLFYWWFKGRFATEFLRNGFIALGFALILGILSWLVESLIVARMRKETWRAAWRPSAAANLVTYLGLILLSIWFQI